MDVRGLRYFMSVAKAGSFSRAASDLHIAQPAISRQVQKLENELGVKLLLRSGRGVQLTGAGFVLMERAETIVRFVQETREQVRGGEDQTLGHLVFGVPPIAGLLLAPAVVAEYQKRWPKVSLHIREGGSASLQEWVLDRRVDLAVLHNPPALEALDIRPLIQEPMVVIGPVPPPGATAPAPAAYRIAELAELPLVMPALPHNNRRLLDQAAAQHGIRLRMLVEVDSVALTKAMIRQGLGYTVATYASVQEEVARGELRATPIERPQLLSTLAIATRREARGSWLAAELAVVIVGSLTELTSSGRWQGAIAYGNSAPAGP